MSTTKADSINAAMSLAEDVAAGTTDPAELDKAVAEECRALFGTVAGPGDGLFALQTDVARQVLADGGLSADEVAEWAAVLKRRAAGAETPEDDLSSANGPHSPDSVGAKIEPEAIQ